MSHIIRESQRERMRDKIVIGAKKYKEYLLGKDFLVICDDNDFYCVRFFASDFVHLTGVDSDLSDDRFFENSVNDILTVGNILENQKYNWSTLKSKTNRIEHIDRILYGNHAASLFMVNLHTKTGNYPVAIRNSEINTCVGFRDAICRARTLRKFSNSSDADKEKQILAIFSKLSQSSVYDELVYLKEMKR